MYDPETAPTEAQVAKYKDLGPMLKSALTEMRGFAKKKQDGVVNAIKIRLINRLLTDLRMVLAQEDSLQYLDLLSETDLPQNSDVVIILGQYEAALHRFSERHYRWAANGHVWITKEWIDLNPEESIDEDEEGDLGEAEDDKE